MKIEQGDNSNEVGNNTKEYLNKFGDDLAGNEKILGSAFKMSEKLNSESTTVTKFNREEFTTALKTCEEQVGPRIKKINDLNQEIGKIVNMSDKEIQKLWNAQKEEMSSQDFQDGIKEVYLNGKFKDKNNVVFDQENGEENGYRIALSLKDKRAILMAMYDKRGEKIKKEIDTEDNMKNITASVLNNLELYPIEALNKTPLDKAIGEYMDNPFLLVDNLPKINTAFQALKDKNGNVMIDGRSVVNEIKTQWKKEKIQTINTMDDLGKAIYYGPLVGFNSSTQELVLEDTQEHWKEVRKDLWEKMKTGDVMGSLRKIFGPDAERVGQQIVKCCTGYPKQMREYDTQTKKHSSYYQWISGPALDINKQINPDALKNSVAQYVQINYGTEKRNAVLQSLFPESKKSLV